MSRRARRIGLLLLGLGAAAGVAALVRRDQLSRHRRNLFSPNPLRRLAALGHLGGEPASIRCVTLLRDFRAWEERTLLRGRAGAILTRMEDELLRHRDAPPATARHGHPLPPAATDSDVVRRLRTRGGA